jgi:hypothetical protein
MINNAKLDELQREIEVDVSEITRVTSELKKARKKIQKAEGIVSIAISGVALAGLIAASVAAANPGTIGAAITAAVGLGKEIRDAAT